MRLVCGLRLNSARLIVCIAALGLALIWKLHTSQILSAVPQRIHSTNLTPANNTTTQRHQDHGPVNHSLLVCVAFHYKEDRLQFLSKVLHRLLDTYTVPLKVVVDSNTEATKQWVSKEFGTPQALTVNVHHNLTNPFHLTWVHRERMNKSINDYDVFMYLEDDMDFPFPNYLRALENFKILWPSMVPTFARIETKDGLLYNTDNLVPTVVSPNGLIELGGRTFVGLKQPYSAMWLMPREALRASLSPKFFDWPRRGLIREAAASYTIWQLGKRGVVEIEDKQVSPLSWAFHLPNNKANDPNTAVGKLLITKVLCFRTPTNTCDVASKRESPVPTNAPPTNAPPTNAPPTPLYRIGDGINFVSGAPGCEVYPDSIVCAYQRKTKTPKSIPDVIKVLEERKPQSEAPDPQVAVVHVRLSDGLCARDQRCHRGGGSGPSDCWNDIRDCFVSFTAPYMRYAYPKEYYVQVVQELTSVKRLVVMAYFNHWDVLPVSRNGTSPDQRYLSQLKEFLESRGFDVELRVNKAPDEDFAYACAARTFVKGGGSFSGLIAEVVQARGGTVLPTETNKTLFFGSRRRK